MNYSEFTNWLISLTDSGISVVAVLLLVVQLPATAILLARLTKGPSRQLPLLPKASTPATLGQVSVLVPTLNEAERVGACLAGLTRQGYEVREMIVIDSCSQDGTVDLVKAAQQKDPRFRLITDDPLPSGWVGRPWALHTGFLASSESSEWILGIDADTQPQPGLVASLLEAAAANQYDVLSVSPQFILKYPGEFWLQPALLVTLIYRFGPAGSASSGAERLLANGQCFLCRRSLLVRLGGYTQARGSFSDDVTLARYAAEQGATVGFLDGSKVLKVRMYEGAWDTWTGWGRSLDLKDSTAVAQTWGDVAFLLAVQGLPLIVTVFLGMLVLTGASTLSVMTALGLNAFLLTVRIALLGGIAATYDRTAQSSWAFWLSPLADPLAVLRVFLSSLSSPTQWRGRIYKSNY
jgi:dolichol-phosphate mannosyltransferase